MAGILVSTAPPDASARQYHVERSLRHQLEAATPGVRRTLYRQLYDERLALLPDHPLLVRAHDPSARAAAAEQQIRLLRRLAGPRSVVVEIGPGDCEVSVGIAPAVSSVIALDVSRGLVMRLDLPRNVRFAMYDGVELPLPPESVDLVYSNQVLEHLHPDDAPIQLAAAYRSLRPGGACLHITPNRLSGPWDVSRGFTESAQGLHLREYTLTELAGLLEAAGFRAAGLVTVRGRVLTRRAPLGAVRLVEAALARLPVRPRRRLAIALAAVKVVGVKPAPATALDRARGPSG